MNAQVQSGLSTLTTWRRRYEEADARPMELVMALLRSMDPSDPAWISLASEDFVNDQFRVLRERAGGAGLQKPHPEMPLYGIPFAVKDNIDAKGMMTTAGCPAYAYAPAEDAPVVRLLMDAGAILIGKTNLDQFATGLVGTRSPYGVVPNAFDARYISGGSSSGSASVVARGIVPFALGTDTAGSGRVPAAFNNLVGYKPTRGAVSTRGVIPACRSLDCVSVLALDVADAHEIGSLISSYDPQDPYSRNGDTVHLYDELPARPQFGVPADLRWFGDAAAAEAFDRAIEAMERLGVRIVRIDFAPFHELADLLYEGPWVAERFAAIENFVADHAGDMHPVVRDIILSAKRFSAADAFKAEYRRASLQRKLSSFFNAHLDAILVPTAPSIYTIAAVQADPVGLNSRLGTYTNFVNLADWSALALPAGFRKDGLPFGISLIGPAWADSALLEFGRRWQEARPWACGVMGTDLSPPVRKNLELAVQLDSINRDPRVRVAVVGAHLSGMQLNSQLTSRGGSLVAKTRTAPRYRLYALPETLPPKPGLIRTDGGVSIEIEVWELPVESYGSFVAAIPGPLGIGTIEIEDGSFVQGFLCESWALTDARDISSFGGWRAFVESTSSGVKPVSMAEDLTPVSEAVRAKIDRGPGT